MGYRIVYGHQSKPGKPAFTKIRSLILTVCFFALFCACARYFFQEEIGLLFDVIFPNGIVEELVQNISNGEGITQVVEAFCQEIFRGH